MWSTIFQAAIAWLRQDESHQIHLDRIVSAVDLNGLHLSALVPSSRHSIASRPQPLHRRHFRAFATNAERHSRSFELTFPAAQFPAVYDTDLQRAHRIEMLSGMAQRSCHFGRRASFRFPLPPFLRLTKFEDSPFLRTTNWTSCLL